MSRWNANTMPDQIGRTIIVTGANSGLGYESALALARKGAHVVMTSRNVDKGEAARQAILREVPDANVEVATLDLANLESVGAFATAFTQNNDHLHVLMNNAGVMAIPYRETADGFEMQFGTNHLGHFALTGLLMDKLLATPNSRVVTVSSGYHHRGTINFDDLHGQQSYSKWVAYSQSKLANLLFTFELQRKLDAIGSSTISVGAHPGYAATNLQHTGPRMEGSGVQQAIMTVANTLFAQSAAMGALPQLYAATAPDVVGGQYYGPLGFMEMRGYPGENNVSEAAQDRAVAARLWSESVKLTGVDYVALTEPVTA